jgi:adenine C2-methylase RlmN of 23S rRNA A2503 and tRNA A37
MICMGQFSHKAFKRFLIKCKNVKHDPIKSREKGYHDDQWVSRQADYVRYLWEAYQQQHYSPSEAQNIWMHAYKTLNKEFQDFKDLHKEVEEKIKTDAKSNKTELVKELMRRLSSKEQGLDGESAEDLLKKLKDQLLEQRKKKLINSINTDVETILPSRESRGSRKELKPSK